MLFNLERIFVTTNEAAFFFSTLGDLRVSILIANLLGAVFWCFGDSDLEMFSSPCVWSSVSLFWTLIIF